MKNRKSLTIADLDAMSDDDFYDMANRRNEYDLDLSDDDKASMKAAYTAWVPTIDADIRDNFDPETRSNFNMYAELRINDVTFERRTAPTLG